MVDGLQVMGSMDGGLASLALWLLPAAALAVAAVRSLQPQPSDAAVAQYANGDINLATYEELRGILVPGGEAW